MLLHSSTVRVVFVLILLSHSANEKPQGGLILNNPRLRERSDRSLG